MRIVLGPKPGEPTDVLTFFYSLFYSFAFIRASLILGIIYALLYILIDVFYLHKKLKNNTYAIIIRFVLVISIAFLIGATIYILKNVFNII